MALEFFATLCAGLFAGASIYINVAEHPARMQCGTALAATEFGPSYKRAAAMQAPLAAFGGIAAVATWAFGSGIAWLLGGLLLAAIVPFTMIVIMPTNKQLLDPTLDKDSELANTLLTRWNQLHAVRSALSTIAFCIFLLY